MLKKLRLENHLSQSELAKRSGVSVRTIQEYEQGRKNIKNAKAIQVYKLAQSLNCTVKDLII